MHAFIATVSLSSIPALTYNFDILELITGIPLLMELLKFEGS